MHNMHKVITYNLLINTISNIFLEVKQREPVRVLGITLASLSPQSMDPQQQQQPQQPEPLHPAAISNKSIQ